jgi:hypothetical protein
MVEVAKRIVVVLSSLSMCEFVECSRPVLCKCHEMRSLFISNAPGLHRYFHSRHRQHSAIQRRFLAKSHRRVVEIISTRAISSATLMATCHKIRDQIRCRDKQRFSEEPGSGDPTAIDLAVISSHRPGFTYLTIPHATSADTNGLGLSAE